MKTERGNVKTSPSHVMRDITVWENVIKEKGRKSFVTIMAFVTMTRMSATSFKLAGSTFCLRTVSRNSRGSGRSGLSKTPKGRQKRVA
eukprot:160659-Ditylum_brightwellii.AAC.1